MRRFVVHRSAIVSGEAAITGSDVKHIRRVLRLKPGDRILLLDGEGREYLARINESTPKAVTVRILHTLEVMPEPRVELAIGMALVKAGKMDRIVRQVTELGAAAFLPFVAQRSIPRPDTDRAEKKRQRWQTIAKEAVKQCGRSRTPRVDAVTSYERLLEASVAYDVRVLFDCGVGSPAGPTTRTAPDGSRKVLALIGPEGGFSNHEVAQARRRGFLCRTLGPFTLRADTAAVAAAVALQHEFASGLWLGPPGPESTARKTKIESFL